MICAALSLAFFASWRLTKVAGYISHSVFLVNIFTCDYIGCSSNLNSIRSRPWSNGHKATSQPAITITCSQGSRWRRYWRHLHRLRFAAEAAAGLEVFKLASTPSDPSHAIAAGLRLISEKTGVHLKNIEVVHGTTVGTNALLERRGARTALVTTARLRGCTCHRATGAAGTLQSECRAAAAACARRSSLRRTRTRDSDRRNHRSDGRGRVVGAGPAAPESES